MSITIVKKGRKAPTTGAEQYEEYRLEGFHDARDGVFHPEAYAKGMARRAYSLGKEQWVELMAQEK
jgi:glycine/D-amino acid oxidase-like deaminating enzyme